MSQYIEREDADLYFLNERPFSEAWFKIGQDNRNKLLIQSTKIIDRLNFVGDKYDSTQELEFPRDSDTTVPQSIKDACCEIAFALGSGVDLEMEAEQLGNEAAVFGPARVSKNPSIVAAHKLHGVPSVVAWRLLLPYLRPSDSIVISRVN